MNPRIWGRSAWDFLYNVAYVYPGDEDSYQKNAYKTFFLNLKYVLPCRMCRDNFEGHTKNIPIDKYLKDNKSLVEWVTKVQNKVCEEKGKRIVNFIDKFQELKNKKPPTFFSDLMDYYGRIKTFIIIILVGILIYTQKNKIKYLLNIYKQR